MTTLETTADWWRPVPAKAPAIASSGSSLAFAGLLAFTAMLILSPQVWFPILGSLRVALLAAGGAIVAEMLNRAISHRTPTRTRREFVIAFCLIGWAALTTPLSYWPGGSIATLTDHFAKAIAFFWLIGTLVTNWSRLQSFLWLLALSALPLAITALQNYADGVFLQTPAGAAPRIAGYNVGGSGLTSNPNDLALMLNLLIPFAAAQFATARRVGARLAAGSALLLAAAGVIVTFSRAGFLTLAAVALFGLVKLAPRRPLVVAATVLLLGIGSRLLPEGYFERLGTITNISADTTGSAQGRWNDLGVAVGIVASNPLTGVGLDQNVQALNRQRGATWREVHNVYLQYAVDLGLPGLALFVALFVTLFRGAGRVWRRARHDGRLHDLGVVAGCAQAALTAFAVAACFHPVAYQFYFFGIAGVALAVQNVATTLTLAPQQPARDAA